MFLLGLDKKHDHLDPQARDEHGGNDVLPMAGDECLSPSSGSIQDTRDEEICGDEKRRPDRVPLLPVRQHGQDYSGTYLERR